MSSIAFRVLGLLALFALVGCASQYDCYPCGKVSCHYCPPKPLPYSNDPSCGCNDSRGRMYLAHLQRVTRPATESELVHDSSSFYQVDDPTDSDSDSKSEKVSK